MWVFFTSWRPYSCPWSLTSGTRCEQHHATGSSVLNPWTRGGTDPPGRRVCPPRGWPRLWERCGWQHRSRQSEVCSPCCEILYRLQGNSIVNTVFISIFNLRNSLRSNGRPWALLSRRASSSVPCVGPSWGRDRRWPSGSSNEAVL